MGAMVLWECAFPGDGRLLWLARLKPATTSDNIAVLGNRQLLRGAGWRPGESEHCYLMTRTYAQSRSKQMLPVRNLGV